MTDVGGDEDVARALRQERMGAELSAPLTDDETSWLDADIGVTTFPWISANPDDANGQWWLCSTAQPDGARLW